MGTSAKPSLPLGLIPIAVTVCRVFFAAFTYGRRKQVAELKDLLTNLHEKVSNPTEDQLDQLGQLISKSQRSFKELIDSFDDVAFATSLDGTIRTVNRQVTKLLNTSYSSIVGRKFSEFVEEPKRTEMENGLVAFLEKRRWSGLVQVRLKDSPRVLYFDCVLNAILKNDEVVGVSTLRSGCDRRARERAPFHGIV